jgi:hypothetical protein
MLIAILIGTVTLVLNLGIQVAALVLVMRFLLGRLDSIPATPDFITDVSMLGVVLAMLFAGHLLQFATWAILFFMLGEFTEFQTAFYHSVVNFTSLGYGDIVMSPRWRLLGALEAANGIMMFGLTTGAVMALMSRMFARHTADGPPPDDESS